MALAQTHYRFGVDSGTESTHGWHAAEDVTPAQGVIPVDTTFLLRFNVQASGGVAHSNIDFQFTVSRNGGAFQNITTSSTIARAVPAAAFVDAASTTKRLSGTGTFEASSNGCTEDGLSGGNNNDIVANGCSECECGLQIRSADVANGDVLAFRLTSPDAAITYTVTPSYTVGIAAPTELTPGRIESAASVPTATLQAGLAPAAVASTASVPAPTVDPTIVAPAIASTTTVQSPDVLLPAYVDPERVESTSSVPTPTTSAGVAPGAIASATQVPSPTFDPSVVPSTIASTASVPTPTVDPALTVPSIASTTLVPEPWVGEQVESGYCPMTCNPRFRR